MKVIILPSGTEAREVQTIDSKDFKRWLSKCEKKRKSGDTYYVFEAELLTKNEAFGQWCNTQAAEEKCRTFEISIPEFKEGAHEAVNNSKLMAEWKRKTEPGSIHEAVVISDGSGQAKATIRIID